MEKCCMLCHDPMDLVSWNHPETKENYTLCSFCARSILGVCNECNDIIVSVDRFGVDEAGYKICSRCVSVHELEDEQQSDKK